MFWVWILSIWEKSYFMLVIFLYIKSTSYFKFFNILIILNNNFLINFHCEFSKIRSALYQNKVTHKLLTLHLRELLWIIFFFWEIISEKSLRFLGEKFASSCWSQRYFTIIVKLRDLVVFLVHYLGLFIIFFIVLFFCIDCWPI